MDPSQSMRGELGTSCRYGLPSWDNSSGTTPIPSRSPNAPCDENISRQLSSLDSGSGTVSAESSHLACERHEREPVPSRSTSNIYCNMPHSASQGSRAGQKMPALPYHDGVCGRVEQVSSSLLDVSPENGHLPFGPALRSNHLYMSTSMRSHSRLPQVNDQATGAGNLDRFHCLTGIAPGTKPKQKRYRATQAQLHELLAVFNINPSPSSAQLASLGAKINMPAQSIALWFKNRRARAPQKISSRRLRPTPVFNGQSVANCSNIPIERHVPNDVYCYQDCSRPQSEQIHRLTRDPNPTTEPSSASKFSSVSQASPTTSSTSSRHHHSRVDSASAPDPCPGVDNEAVPPLSPTMQKTHDAAAVLLCLSEISRRTLM